MMKECERHELRWKREGISMAFRKIPAGRFRMGSRGHWSPEEPIHEVRITQAFWMGETPVTQAQFALWTKSEKREHKNHFEGRADHPAEELSWHDAEAYLAWLGSVKGARFPQGASTAALPAEAQWEYACRAGSETEYGSGDGEAALDEVGWFGADWESGSTHPVGMKAPNNFGLYDMHGNVWEWCEDMWDGSAYQKRASGVANPVVVESTGPNPLRVLRGGSWNYSAVNCRSAVRTAFRPDARIRNIGFRVCLVCRPAGEAERQAQEAEPVGTTEAKLDGMDVP